MIRFLVAACLLASIPASAAELKVLTAGAFKSTLLALLPEFERRTGHHVTVQNDTAGGLQKRVAAGEAFDLAILTPATIEPLVRAGQITQPTPVASVGIGVGVKQGAPAPDLSSVAAFKAALLAARKVAIIDPASGGTSGIYLAKLFETWGIAEQMKPKLVLSQGGLTAEIVARGEADIALQQASEILGVPGVILAGPVPAEVQSVTVYVAGLGAAPSEPARALLAALTDAAARAVLVQRGMAPP